MRIVADVVDNVFSSIRLIFLLGFAVIVLFGLFMTVGATVIAPQAVDAAAEHAERLGDRAITAAERDRRNARLATEGWGYEEPNEGSGATYEDGEVIGGWGNND